MKLKKMLPMVLALILSANAIAASSKLPKELDCLTRNIYYESGNQSYKGKLAVALVTINRAEDPRYPNTICKVVYQPWQFSWTRDTQLLSKKINNQQWFDSFLAAKEALTNRDVLGNFYATHFHNTSISPKWGLKRVAKIGEHIFYK